jgi:hypothetical protein
MTAHDDYYEHATKAQTSSHYCYLGGNDGISIPKLWNLILINLGAAELPRIQQ